jgi:putative transposase
MWSGTMSL